MRVLVMFVVLCGTGLGVSRGDAPPATPPSGNASIRGKFGESEIVITTTNRLAGAIHSITWNGKEFIDSHDHGRQLQSASSFDCAKAGEFWAECFNPTEAGSRADGAGKTSTSKLLEIQANGTVLHARSQMAFWLKPGEKSAGRPALNEKALSQHLLTKTVRIGYKKLANVIEYETTFSVPKGENHKYGQFEALTGYMPPEFSKFWKLPRETGKLEQLDDGPGEQKHPIVFASATGTHAMGVFSPDQPARGYENAGYGRWRFKAEKVVKWNCVFRVRSETGIASGEYCYRVFVAVGTQEDVRVALNSLMKEFAKE